MDVSVGADAGTGTGTGAVAWSLQFFSLSPQPLVEAQGHGGAQIRWETQIKEIENQDWKETKQDQGNNNEIRIGHK